MANTIDITFLGTGSAQPSTTRNHSSLGVRMNGTVWLFDVGEGIQRQLMYSTLKLGKINKIFITHLHGDHIYGLPGLVCTLTAALNPQNHMDANWDEEEVAKNPENTPCLEIYGPEGLRHFLRSALTFSYSRLPIYYRVHELILPEQESKEFMEATTSLDKQAFLGIRHQFDQQMKDDILHPDELLGENIHADADGLFRDLLQVEVKKNEGKNNKKKNKNNKFKSDSLLDKIRVSASYIKHSVPTLGYVLEECAMKGNVKMEIVEPILLRNKEALAAQGIKQPLSLLRDLKNGKVLNLPDGSRIDPKEVISPSEQRKIVVLGDTYNPSKIIPLAQNPTILIHEATNMYEGDDDENKDGKDKGEGNEEDQGNEMSKEKTNENTNNNTSNNTDDTTNSHTLDSNSHPDNNNNSISAAEEYRLKVMSRGHSTPEMAGAFASKINAQYLILNHFSSRYSSLDRMGRIEIDWEDPALKEKAQQISTHYSENNPTSSSSSSSSSSSISYSPLLPFNPPKRDLLSEKEKQQHQKAKEQNQNHGISLEKRKYLSDWKTMEKIRCKAASTFQPSSLDHIVLADDYLQVECHRQKVQLENAKKQNDDGTSILPSLPLFRAWNNDIILSK